LVLEVYLFGSRVRGRNWQGGPVRHDSDLDVGIRMDLPPAVEFSDAFHAWLDFKPRAERALAPLLLWPLELWQLAGLLTPAVEGYVAECSLLAFRRQEKAPPAGPRSDDKV
jgi:hypothetical protein